MGTRREGGQATVELALLLPLVAFLIAALVEVGVIAVDEIRLWHAAREAARVAAVDPDPDAIRAAAERSGLSSLQLSVQPEMRSRRMGDPVTVSVSFDPQTIVPMIGDLIVGGDLHARATMRIEQ